MTILIFFIGGLLIGSFLNVVVYRIQEAESLLGRSYCPKCKKKISWYDNIPLLSFILLRFHCRNCREKISWQYPLVELLTGMLFLAVGMKFFDPNDVSTFFLTAYYLAIISFLIVILVYDFLYMEIPGLALWPAILLAVMFNFWGGLGVWGDVGILGSRIFSGALAAAVGFLFFFSLVAVSREKWMGMGDAYLAILLGLILGWPVILLALFLSFLFGATYGIILILARKKSLKSQIPFAPFLIFGTIISIFFSMPILNWYTGLFNF